MRAGDTESSLAILASDPIAPQVRCSAVAPHAVIRSICTTHRHEHYLHDIQSLQDLGQALIAASRAGSSELVQALIGSAADPNSRGPSKCSCKHCPRCITFVDAAGSTSLHAAAHNGHLECAQLLVDAGANPAVADHEGLTAIHQAALASSQVIPSHLVAHHPQTGTKPLVSQ